MHELFRLKIAAKRQVTLPQRLLNQLQLSEGDEIRLEVADGQIVSVEACKVVPTRLFTPEIREQLAEREAEMAKGKTADINIQQWIDAAKAEEGTEVAAADTGQIQAYSVETAGQNW